MTVYVVLRLHWEYQDDFHALSSDEPMRAYVSRDDAVTVAEAIEAQERAALTGFNLAKHFGYDDLSAAGPEALSIRLVAAGAPPLTEPDDDAWWEEAAPTMTDDQRAAIWRWCDPEPYAIVEVELEETV